MGIDTTEKRLVTIGSGSRVAGVTFTCKRDVIGSYASCSGSIMASRTDACHTRGWVGIVPAKESREVAGVGRCMANITGGSRHDVLGILA